MRLPIDTSRLKLLVVAGAEELRQFEEGKPRETCAAKMGANGDVPWRVPARRVSYVKVVEYQHRGLVHLHPVIGLDRRMPAYRNAAARSSNLLSQGWHR